MRVVRLDGRAGRAFPFSFGPAWSPDGKRLAFTHDEKPYRDVPPSLGAFYEFTLRVARMDGGPATGYLNCSNAVWSPDGRSIACVDFLSDTIWAVSAGDGSFKPVTSLAGGGEIHHLWWSADGNRIFISWEFTNFD